MTTTEKKFAQRRPRPQVAAAAARAAIEIREYDGRDVPDWLRAAATGTEAKPNTRCLTTPEPALCLDGRCGFFF